MLSSSQPLVQPLSRILAHRTQDLDAITCATPCAAYVSPTKPRSKADWRTEPHKKTVKEPVELCQLCQSVSLIYQNFAP
jgi:hypothetical protein